MRCLITVHVLLLFTGFAPAVAQSLTCCPLLGADIAERYRVRAIDERRFTHDDLWDALLPFDGAGGVSIADVGRSLHDRAIRAVSFGTGPTSVLLWSQMHGDESTATMALADVIRFFAEGSDDPLRATIRDKLSVTMVPMLNPDGAERYQRYNAAGVDINRDARRLATPEARALKVLRDTLEPAFGFNLHDQGARTTAGEHGEQVAVALLAPAADSARSYGPVRGRARQLAALLAQGLEAELPGRTAKYDDAFNPRAFGDLIQQWGTSTVLIESGALPGDPEKQALRRVNVMLLLTALEAIATERYERADTAVYEALPFNERAAADLLVRGGRVVLPSGEVLELDLALTYDDPVAHTGLTLSDVGDLADLAALDTLDATGTYLHLAAPSAFDPGDWWLLRRERVRITVREGPDVTAPLRRRLPAQEPPPHLEFRQKF
jgi:hypothetical protein